MAKRRMVIMAVLLCFCLSLVPCSARAASLAGAKGPISTDKACTLTISYGYGGRAVPGETIKLYKIADVSAEARYTLTAAFAGSGLVVNGVQTNGEWDVIRSTLEAYILAGNIAPAATAVTDEAGFASFTQLVPGLYLAPAVNVVREEGTCVFASALVAVPGLAVDGQWQYQVAVAAKPELLPPAQPDEVHQFKVLKLWKGDEGPGDRPKSVQVEIFRDGVSVETVTLSEENHWSYSWTAKADGAAWNVAEKNIPSGYAMTVERRGNAFVIVNARFGQPEQPNRPGQPSEPTQPSHPGQPTQPGKPDQPGTTPPKTGDTSHILLYTLLMYGSGAMLILLGLTGRRRSHEE